MFNKDIAIVGCGYWGKNLVRNFSELGALKTICDESETVLDTLSKQYGGVKCAKNINDILLNQSIRGVVIAAPAARHYQLAKMVLEAGKDVFVEKPLALRLTEGQELAILAKKNNRILMIGHVLEYHPAIDKLKGLVKSGMLGRINYIYSNRLSMGKIRQEENVLWSFAPHDISVILSILDESPREVSACGSSYLNHNIADVTLSSLKFSSGVMAHIFVSWLHPYKEQKLVVVGSEGMAVFNDTVKEDKLVVYPHKVQWQDSLPLAVKAEGRPITISADEPLKLECKHFLECIHDRIEPKTGSKNGLDVLGVLDALQLSLDKGGITVSPNSTDKTKANYFAHETAVVDAGAVVGEKTKIWHFSHVMKESEIGRGCNIGQNCVISPGVRIGNNVKIQNNISVYTGVRVEDDAFLGPSMVFTNVYNPRSFIERKNEYKETIIKKGASIGANATIVCGVTVGEYSFIGAGAVVTRDVPQYALVYGNPGKVNGWVCRCGWKLAIDVDYNGIVACRECNSKYSINNRQVEMTEKGNYASTSSRS